MGAINGILMGVYAVVYYVTVTVGWHNSNYLCKINQLDISSYAYWVILHAFFCHLLIVFKIMLLFFFKKKNQSGIPSVSNRLDPDHV